MKNFKYNLSLFILSMLVFSSCQDEDQEFGDIITPTNILITADIVGVDATNPNGDGSGTVNFSATADNTISYKFVYNGIETSSPTGKMTYNFAVLGLSTYTVTVVATGTAGVASSADIQVDVLSTYAPPAELLDKLHGGTSKTWRVKSEKSQHFGLSDVGGPAFQHYGAGVDEKAGVGMYNDRYIFNIDGTFTHITDGTNDTGGDDPSGDVFGRNGLVDELGATGGNVNGDDVENLPFNDYSESWFVTAPGGLETITISGLGFIAYYTGGDHTYQIIDRSVPNELLLKTTDGNNGFDWWFVITSD